MFKKSIKSIFQKIIKPRIEFFDILFFFILFIIGIYISKDFGISWDESHHRHSGQKVLAYLVGQIMKETSGKANPKKVNELIRTILEL